MSRIDNTNMDTFTLRRLFKRIFAELTFLKKHGGGGGGGGGGEPDNIKTDLSLYFDTETRELRGNLSSFTQRFTWQSGAQEFILNEIPVDIVYINVMGQILYDELEQWQVDTEQKKITILDELQEDDIISIRFTYIITE